MSVSGLALRGRKRSVQRLDGCVFAGRCSLATDLCRKLAPGLEQKGPGHIAACHYASKEAAEA